MTDANAARRGAAGAAVLRSEITAALRDALLQELAATGYGRLSIEAVARRAGVAKTAVYRRWPSKLEMVLDVVNAIAGRRLDLPDTGSLRGDLELAMHGMASALRHPLASQIIPDLLAEAARNPDIGATLQHALAETGRTVGGQVVERAIDRGELPPGTDAESAADLVIGPLYWRLAVLRKPCGTAEIRGLARAAAAAIAGVG